MGTRSLNSFTVLLVIALVCPPAISAAPASLQKATDTRVAWFSSTDGEKFAALSVSTLVPARVRVGPFHLSSPGLQARGIRLELRPVACAPADWAGLLEQLDHLPSDPRTPFILITPDGRAHRLLGSPRVQDGTLVATAVTPRTGRPLHLRVVLGPDGRPTLAP